LSRPRLKRTVAVLPPVDWKVASIALSAAELSASSRTERHLGGPRDRRQDRTQAHKVAGPGRRLRARSAAAKDHRQPIVDEHGIAGKGVIVVSSGTLFQPACFATAAPSGAADTLPVSKSLTLASVAASGRAAPALALRSPRV